ARAVEFVRRENNDSQHLRVATRQRPESWWPRGADQHAMDSVGFRPWNVTDTPSLTGLSTWTPSNTIGHIVLGWPDSATRDKAYYEPGGSFSPAVRSFGVSIWMTDTARQVYATSDEISIDLLRHELIWNDDSEIPGIIADCMYYRGEWSIPQRGTSTL